MRVTIELFGDLQAACDGNPISAINTNRLQSLLAYLALHSGVAQPRDRLAGLLWPDSGDSQARTNLRQLLHHLRRALPPGCTLLEADNSTVLWRRDAACFVDAAAFDEAVGRASAAARSGDVPGEIEALEDAARLYQDDLLSGIYDEWVEPVRQEYRQKLSAVLGRLSALLEQRRDFAAAIPHAERLVAHEPLRETYHQALIRLHAANGDRASALRVYHQCMRILRRELAVEPEAATRELFERVLRSEKHSSALAEHATPASAPALPLVGRRGEWDRMTAYWRGRPGRPAGMVVLSGEPGIGKSRLAEELVDWCARQKVATARARCYAAQGQLAYAPISEWLRSEPLRAARGRLSKPQLAELARVLPEILAEDASMPRPHPLSESWERHHFYESLLAAFGGASRPLLLAIDDLQWCDPDSLEWMHTLFRAEAARGVLVVATLRPEETGRAHPFTRLLQELKRSDQVLEVPLDRLGTQETQALGTQVAGRPLDSEETAGLYRTTQGNPLFVVESVRAGLRDGGKAAAPRIHAVIGARLAQLSPPAYELAGLAGAVGQSFSFDLLAKATDWDEDSVSRALEEMWQRSLIHEQGTEYDFTHDRIREVAYAELTPVRRRYWHRRIARAIAELRSDDPGRASGQLAAHYEAAGMVEEAIQHYRAAASVAQERFANTEVAEMLRRALALCLTLPETARRDAEEQELLVTLGPALVSTQGYAAAEVGERYERALELTRRLGDGKHLLSVLSGVWVFYVVRAQLDRALDFAGQFLEAARKEGRELELAGHFPLASSVFPLGRFAESRTHIETVLSGEYGYSHPALKLFAGSDIATFSRSYLSHSMWLLGHADQAAALAAEAVAGARSPARPFSLAIALNYAAMLHLFRRESDRALALADEAAALCRKHDFEYYRSMAEIVAGWAQAREGALDRGLARLRAGMEALRATGAEMRLPFYYALLAEICALAGRMGDALANVSTGLAFQSKNGEVWASPDLYRVEGELLAANGSCAAAEAAYRRSIDAARQFGAPILELRAATRLSKLLLSETARAEVDRLYRAFTEGFDTPDLRDANAARTLSERAR